MDKKELRQKFFEAEEELKNPEDSAGKKKELYDDICRRVLDIFPLSQHEVESLENNRLSIVSRNSGDAIVELERNSLPVSLGAVEDIPDKNLYAKLHFRHLFSADLKKPANPETSRRDVFENFEDTSTLSGIEISFMRHNHPSLDSVVAVSRIGTPLAAHKLKEVEDLSSSLSLIEEALAAKNAAV